MNFIVEHIASIFCYLSSFLVAWSLYLSYEHLKVIDFKKSINEYSFITDKIQMLFLLAFSFILILTLFYFQNSISSFTDMLIVLEIWYTAFLLRISTYVYKSLNIINTYNTRSFVHQFAKK